MDNIHKVKIVTLKQFKRIPRIESIRKRSRHTTPAHNNNLIYPSEFYQKKPNWPIVGRSVTAQRSLCVLYPIHVRLSQYMYRDKSFMCGEFHERRSRTYSRRDQRVRLASRARCNLP